MKHWCKRSGHGLLRKLLISMLVDYDFQNWYSNWLATQTPANLKPSWWRHQMETFSALLALCAKNSPVPGEFPSQMPVTRSFDVFCDLRLYKRLSKQSWGWWFWTSSRPLWRHCNDARTPLVITMSFEFNIFISNTWPCTARAWIENYIRKHSGDSYYFSMPLIKSSLRWNLDLVVSFACITELDIISE